MNDAPIRIGHADEGFAPDPCGCCAGAELATLRPTANRPNLSAIAFRVGDHPRFKASMLTGLASAAHPALARLGTREDDDFSIALIDAWAAACDVLTFYQERLANEAYMGTATERLSIGELARLIGYRLHPGVAAETDLVLLMEDPPAAEPDVAALIVPAGARVQSQPGPDETPQIFETIEEIETRVAWNTVRPRLTRPIAPDNGHLSTWLEGLPALQVGDAILIVGRDRAEIDAGSELWDFRRVTTVEPDPRNNRTRIVWDRALGSVAPPGLAAQQEHRFHHLRDRAALFGYNAPHPRVLSATQRGDFGYTDDPLEVAAPGSEPTYASPSRIRGSSSNVGDWAFSFPDSDQISLDGIYKSFVKDSWVVLTRPAAFAELYRITEAVDDSEARYAVSGKTTRLTLDTDEHLEDYEDDYRRVSVYGGSVEYPFAETPITEFVAGAEIEIDRRLEGPPEGRRLIFRGARARLKAVTEGLTLKVNAAPDESIARGDVLILLSEPLDAPETVDLVYEVETALGLKGHVTAIPGALETVPAPDDAEQIAESATLFEARTIGPQTTLLRLTAALGAAFDRASLRIHANVARAAHGEGVTEILGSGDPSRPFQKFLLKQAPVTQRAAPTETGVESTLTLRIDGVEWKEAPDLHDRGPTARVFKTSLTDDGQTVVEFGDGVSGARPTPGRDNIVVDHSRGLGRDGNVRADTLTMPLDRPLGLKAVTNPLPATGGDDAEDARDARRNAPIHTLTLGRVVSLTDYRDFALGYPGVAKAEARWVWQGQTRRIVVTVAGPGGAEIPKGSTTHDNLLGSFRALGDPLVGVDLLSYAPARFRLGLRVAVDKAYDPDAVLEATEAAFRDAFAFERRNFGELLALSEVAQVAHRVAGLKAVDIDLFYREKPPQDAAILHQRLVSQQGRLGDLGELLPAEILMLSPAPLDVLEVMA